MKTSPCLLLFAALLLLSPLHAQDDDFSFFDDGEEDDINITFDPTVTKKPPSKDKSMGFGRRLRARLNAKKAQQLAPNNPSPAAAPPPNAAPAPNDPGATASDMGYYYIEQGEAGMAADYLQSARENVDVTDGDAVLELFELYALLAYELYAEGEGSGSMAEDYLTMGESVLFAYLDTAPNDYEAAYVLREVADLYYELSDYTMAAYFFTQVTDFTLLPEDAYMAASALALEEDIERALDYLELALDLGFLEEECMDIASDSDLETLRGTSRYVELSREYGF